MDHLLTKEDLSHALQTRLALAPADADASAESVLDIFGFESEVIDNVLAAEDRQLFYNLQARGLLTTRVEETPLWNGQGWRTHYWMMREDRIRAASRTRAPDRASRSREGEDGADVYAALPSAAWARHA